MLCARSDKSRRLPVVMHLNEVNRASHQDSRLKEDEKWQQKLTQER